MGLSEDELRLLDLAATVHDIGRFVVPAEFLSKPKRLSQAKYAFIKQHCDACLSLFREQAFGFVQEAALRRPARAP
jgi:response regulator RpfG family c-di-GMP phosphodiesterase